MSNAKRPRSQGALFLFCFFGVMFLLLFVRIIYLQTTSEIKGNDLKERAAEIRARKEVLPAERGKIVDHKGAIIVEDTTTYRLQATLESEQALTMKIPYVSNVENTAKILAKHINMSEKDIVKQLTQPRVTQVEFGVAGKDLDFSTKQAIEEEGLPGITFSSEAKRFHPNGVFASNLIGYARPIANKDGKIELVGEMGLEAIYNKQLTGKDGLLKYEGAKMSSILPNSERDIQPPENGDTIQLTVIKNIQNFLEEEMDAVYKQYKPKAMSAVMVDPKTGRVLAITQRPTFNPSTLSGEGMSWLNAPVEQTIEPGSTMKMFTLAAAVDSGNWTPNAYYQSGRYRVKNTEINDHNFRGWGTITYLEGIQRSSNTAIAHMLDIMGTETFYSYLDKFGFGKPTGIDLPNEASGILLSEEPIERITTAFGQGSTFTPIQLIQAATAIANDGEMMRPFVIEKIIDETTGKVVEQHKPKQVGQPISKESAAVVRDVLASTVTSKYGSAQSYKLDEYEVAGKTATAQVPREDGGGYYAFDNNNFLYGFLGMAPKEDPQVLMYVDITMPNLSDGEYGSKPVSKVFNAVMSNSLKYLNVNTTEVEPVEKTIIEDYSKTTVQEAQLALEAKGIIPVIIGSGDTIVEQFPKVGKPVVSGTRVFLKTEGPSTLPSFTGWSLQSILTYEALTGLSIETNGQGFVVSQSVSAGTQVTENTTIVLRLQTPEERFTPKPEEITEPPLEPKLPDGYEGLEEGESLQQFDNPNIEPGGVG